MRRSDSSRFTQAARAAIVHAPSGPPAGWVGEAEAGLLDAVLSVRATYGRPGSGVRAAVDRWRTWRGARVLDDLDALASVPPSTLAVAVDNRQRLAGGTPKAVAVVDVGRRLVSVGVHHARDLRADSPDHRAAMVDVVGLGPLTWDYFLLVLAAPDRPADPRLRSFAVRVLDTDVDDAALGVLLHESAQRLDLPLTTLELALWRAEARARRAVSEAELPAAVDGRGPAPRR